MAIIDPADLGGYCQNCGQEIFWWKEFCSSLCEEEYKENEKEKGD